MPDQNLRDYYMKRLASKKEERSSFDDHYMNLAEFVSPRRGRFNKGERNQGGRSYWNKIINGHATWALRVATAGLFNGVMSPSRPWFMLTDPDKDLMEQKAVKEWYYYVQEQMRTIFNNSNIYGMAPMMFREMLLFGTGCMSHTEDDEKLCRFYTHTAGSYYLGQNDKFEVDTVYREFEMSVGQIMSKFSNRDGDNKHISPIVRNQYDKGNYDAYFPVVHAVEPNSNFKPGDLKHKNRKFRSVFFEPANVDKDMLLSDKGMKRFPFYCPRWELTNEDIYGTDCPGMTALGDIRQLQHQEKRKAQGIDKMISPPLHGPPSLRNQPISQLPSGATLYDPSGTHILKPVYEVRLPIDQLNQDLQGVMDRINRYFYVDIFQAITSMEGIQPRNQLELQHRHQERLLQLGPVLERMFGEFLNHLIDNTFEDMVGAGDYENERFIVPPPPEIIQGRPMKAQYISTLAMAQQSATTGNIDRLVSFVAALQGAGLIQDTSKFNGDEAIDEYARLIGAPPELVVADDEVAKGRAARAQQAASQQALMAGQAMAETAKTASQADLETDNVMSRMASNMAK